MESFYRTDYFRTTAPMDFNDFLCKYKQLYKQAVTLVEDFGSKNLDDVPRLRERTSKTRVTAYPINDFARKLNVVQCKEYFDSKMTYAEMMTINKRYLKPNVKPIDPSIVVDIQPGDDFIFSILVNNCLFIEVPDTKVDLTSEEFDAKKKYPSQTIFIENVFYNDFRSPHSIDLSKEVIEWAKRKNLGQFVSQPMWNVYLKDLKLKLGYPYVYIHQGNCEHIISFSDAKLLSEPSCSR
nr:unnamed protein product [Callosobruchus analis]